MINSYTYGTLIIGNQRYVSDLIIYPDWIDDTWGQRRVAEHQIGITDLVSMLYPRPEYLILGTGQKSHLYILPEAQEYVRQQGTQLIFLRTGAACQMYNKIAMKRHVIGAFHLGC